LVCQTVGGQFFLFCQNYMDAKLVCQIVGVALRGLPSQALPWETHSQGAQPLPRPGHPSIYRGRKKTSCYTLFPSSNGSLGLSAIHSRTVCDSKN
jgi:hypothetical protein